MEQGAVRTKRLRRASACLSSAVLVLLVAGPVGGQVAYEEAAFSASATGTVLHADVLRAGDTKVVDAEVAFTGASFDSEGLHAPATNEVQRVFTPARSGKTAYARGSAVEAGLAVTPADDNQVILAGKAEADSPEGGTSTEEIGPLDLAPLAWANLLRGRALAKSKDGMCGLGSDLSRGTAYAADVQLLDTGGSASASASGSSASAPKQAEEEEESSSALGDVVETVTEPVRGLLGALTQSEPTAPVAQALPVAKAAAPATTKAAAVEEEPAEGLVAPLVALDANDPKRAVSQSRSRTVMVPQVGADGKALGSDFGIMSEVRQTIAPVTLFKGTPSEITIELLGEWVLQAVATGEAGGAYIHYGPGEVQPSTPVLRLLDATGVNTLLTLQDLLGDEGLVIEIPGVAEIAIGEDPRAIGGHAGTKPSVAADGTSATAAVDVVRVRLLPGAPAELADVRVGHMEVRTAVPQGGVSCPIPVTKTPDASSVDVGKTFTVDFEVANPYDCVLTDVSIVDEVTTEGNARFEVVSTDPEASSVPSGSHLEQGTVEWHDVGDIATGEKAKVSAVFRALDGRGSIVDKATASAKLADCAEEGSTVGGVDVSVVDASLTGRTGDVRVDVIATEVLGEVQSRELPLTGWDILRLVLLGMGMLVAGGAAITLAYRVR
jgi:hypothetical protein